MRTTLPVHPIDLEPFRTGGAGRASRGRAAARRGVPRHRLPRGHRPRGPPGHLRRRARRVRRVLRPPRAREAGGGGRRSRRQPRATARSARKASSYSRGEESPRDLFEAFNVGSEDTDGEYYERHRSFFAPNTWPAEPGHLRDAWREYDRAVTEVADTILQAMATRARPARAVVRRTVRARHHHDARDQLRAPGRHARSGRGPDAHGRAHRLRHPHRAARRRRARPPGVPRRRVARRVDAAWRVRVQPRRHARPLDQRPLDLDAAPGRARRRPTRTGPVRRRSIARFLDCPPDLVVETIPSCIDAEHPARYEPVNAGEWLRAKVLGSRALQLNETDDIAARHPSGGTS